MSKYVWLFCVCVFNTLPLGKDTFPFSDVVDCLFSLLAGIWLKPSRMSRMREKRADFVAGCLGGRVIAAGGLGQHLLSFKANYIVKYV